MKVVLGTAIVVGILAFANGVCMLLAPHAWYFAVPGVTMTGPFNQHFIRDIGMIFLLVGLAFLVGAAKAEARAWLWGSAAFWLTGHALFHVWEVLAGLCGSGALVRDFPLVSLPAILALALAGWAFANRRSDA